MDADQLRERFTERARKVMKLANEEAHRFNHAYIGTEHILLGLLKDGNGVAANVLKNLGIGLQKIHLEVEKLIQSGPDMVTGKLPWTPRVKKVVDYSVEEARNMGHNFVGTEHILLGLLREEGGVAATILMNLGLHIEQARREIENLLGKSQFPAESNAETLDLPKVCPKCGHARIVRVVWGAYYLSDKDLEEIKSAQALLGSVKGDKKGPLWVCLECAPKWSEVHNLAMQDYELQLEKERAIESQDFEKAAQCLRSQEELRRRLSLLYEELLRGE